MHKSIQVIAAAASIFALGLGMLIEGWHPGIGVFLMVTAVFYLLYALLTFPAAIQVVPEPMLRFLAGVMVLCALIAASAEGIKERLYPTLAHAECSVPSTGSPCELDCSAANGNPVAIRDVSVGFVGPLPMQTVVAASPDRRVQLRKSESLPIPDPSGKVMREVRSFTVDIPVLPPYSQTKFVVWTDDEINRKACEQAIGIDHKLRRGFADLLSQAKFSNAPDLDTLLSALIKNGSLFQPDEISSEKGREPVSFRTPEEKSAIAMLNQMRAVYPNWKPIFSQQGSCLAPVIHFEMNGGQETTMGMFIPQIEQNAFVMRQIPKHVRKREKLEMPYIVPQQYDCTNF